MKLIFVLFAIWTVLALGKTYEFGANERAQALRIWNAEAARVESLPNKRSGSAPIILLHPVGTKVLGSVLIFHGYLGTPLQTTLQANACFAAGYNVVSINLAGHSQESSYWPATLLRNRVLRDKIRNTLLNEPRLANITKDIESNEFNFIKSTAPIMPIVREVVRSALTDEEYKQAEQAFKTLGPFPGVNSISFANDIHSMFLSEYRRYEMRARNMVAKMQSLPGPLNVLGYSLGGANAVYSAAFQSGVSKLVLFAPYFGETVDSKSQDTNQYIAIAGATELFKLSSGGSLIALPSWTSVQLFGRWTARDSVTQSVRETTRTLCVIAADDDTATPARTREVCQSKLGAHTFEYPARFRLGHGVIPEAGHPFAEALIGQVLRFLRNGTVDDDAFTMRNTSSDAQFFDNNLLNVLSSHFDSIVTAWRTNSVSKLIQLQM